MPPIPLTYDYVFDWNMLKFVSLSQNPLFIYQNSLIYQELTYRPPFSNDKGFTCGYVFDWNMLNFVSNYLLSSSSLFFLWRSDPQTLF